MIRRLNVEVPSIPFPGGHLQSHFFRTAARNIEQGYKPGGSNVTEAVLKTLRNVAQAIDDETPESEGLSVIDARHEMIQELAVALHGDELTARSQTPQEVWFELLDEVRKLAGQE